LYLLGSVQHQGWKYFATLDEAWFYLSNQHEQIWPGPGRLTNNSTTNDQQPENNADSVWNSHGFHLVFLLPEGQKWTSQYSIDHILPEICTLRDTKNRRKSVWTGGQCQATRRQKSQVISQG
jgi:hypothetical protein